MSCGHGIFTGARLPFLLPLGKTYYLSLQIICGDVTISVNGLFDAKVRPTWRSNCLLARDHEALVYELGLPADRLEAQLRDPKTYAFEEFLGSVGQVFGQQDDWFPRRRLDLIIMPVSDVRINVEREEEKDYDAEWDGEPVQCSTSGF